MSTRSSVGIALKRAVWVEWIRSNHGLIQDLEDLCEKRYNHEEGVFYYLPNVMWSDDNALYKALEKVSEDDYLIRGGFHAYPTDTSCNAGNWNDNPWKLSVAVSVSVSFEETSIDCSLEAT